MSYFVSKYLDLSTAHISLKTLDHDSLPFHLGDYAEGVFMWIPADLDEQEGIPDDLRTVFKFALAHDCNIVRFDSEGFQIKELPLFDW